MAKRTKKQIKEQGERTAQHILDHFENEIVRDWHYGHNDASTKSDVDDLEAETMKALKKLVTEKVKTNTERKKIQDLRKNYLNKRYSH